MLHPEDDGNKNNTTGAIVTKKVYKMENKMLAALYANFQKERQAEWEAAKARAVKAATAAMEKKREREGKIAAATATRQ